MSTPTPAQATQADDTTITAAPVDRVRRRHLVAAVAAEIALDHQAASDLIHVIETVVERNAGQHELFAILPRAGSVADRPGGFPGHVPLTILHRHAPLDMFADQMASAARVSVDTVTAALAVIAQVVESAPTSAAVYVPGWGYHGDDTALEAVRRQDRQELVSHYRTHPQVTWVLQCNPAKWDVFGYIDDTGTLPSAWSIGRYRQQISEGDRVVFWLAGPTGGVYAIGDVLGLPELSQVDVDYLGVDVPDGRWEWFVPIALDLDLFDEPVLRSDLNSDPRFADEPILRAPWAANPHPMSPDAFEAVLDRVELLGP